MFGWDDVIGQKEAKAQLLKEAREGHIPHALLLCGPSGCGKLPLALSYARYLSCPNRTETQACGQCPSCVQWNKLVHPDVHFMFPIVIDKSSKLEVCNDYLPQWRAQLIKNSYLSLPQWMEAMDGVNKQALIPAKESDEITKALSLKSSSGGYKITLIWLPERMHEVCANKMLKLLEEPPQGTLFLLVSEEPDKILPTILSRTQRFNLPKITDEDMSQALENKMGIAPRDAKTIAHLANGSFIQALETINLNEDNEEFFELFCNILRYVYQARSKMREIKQWSDQVAGMGRERQKNFLEYFQRMIRESFINNFHLKEINYMSIQEQNFTNRFSPFVNERNVNDIMFEITEAQIHVEQNVNPKMVFFDFALKLSVLIKK